MKIEELERLYEEQCKGKSEEKTCVACEISELVRAFESLPFADYKNFADCVAKNQDKENPSAYCAAIARKTGEIKSLSPAKFTLHFNSWMGQFVVRGVPKREWYLRVDDKGEGKIRSWLFEYDPLYYEPISGEYEGRVDRKWLDFDGELPPRTEYNPNKKIPARMKIIDQGAVEIKEEIQDGREIIQLTLRGKKLKGKWRLTQEEKGASSFTFEKLSLELEETKFVLQRHWIPLKPGAKFPEDYGQHLDIRFSFGLEFNLYGNPLEAQTDQEIKAVRKTCKDVESWMAIAKEHTPKKVGPLETFVDPVDKGRGEIYEMTPDFVSMKFFGEKLKGYFVYRRKATGEEVFMRSSLPQPKEEATMLAKGDPASGDYFKPFEIEKKEGWDYFWLHIYSSGGFTRCVEDPKKYLPDLSIPSEVQEILVCLYRRPGTIHGARVRAIKVSDKWTPEQASEWVRKNGLHTWQGVLIREKREENE